MTADNATRNLATMAQMRLDRLARCKGIKPRWNQDDDSLVVCENCGFILHAYGGTWRHDLSEVHAMRQVAMQEAWPSHNYRNGDGTPIEDSPVEPTHATDLPGLVAWFVPGRDPVKQ